MLIVNRWSPLRRASLFVYLQIIRKILYEKMFPHRLRHDATFLETPGFAVTTLWTEARSLLAAGEHFR